ncbi:MAG TPA: hypothetical protein VF207_08310 [Chthoniobacterales bacterium]
MNSIETSNSLRVREYIIFATRFSDPMVLRREGLEKLGSSLPDSDKQALIEYLKTL